MAKGKRVPREQWVVLCTALCAGTFHDAFLKVWLGRDGMSFDPIFFLRCEKYIDKGTRAMLVIVFGWD